MIELVLKIKTYAGKGGAWGSRLCWWKCRLVQPLWNQVGGCSYNLKWSNHKNQLSHAWACAQRIQSQRYLNIHGYCHTLASYRIGLDTYPEKTDKEMVCVCTCMCASVNMLMCECVYMHVCMCVYVYVFSYVWICVYVCAHMYMCMVIYICVYVYVHVCVCICVYAYVRVCVCICVYVCACICFIRIEIKLTIIIRQTQKGSYHSFSCMRNLYVCMMSQ